MTLKISGLHQLGQSLGLMGLHEDALRVREAELALVEQLGYPEEAVAHFRTSVELCRIRAAPGTDVSATNTSKEHWGNLVKMHGEGAAVTLIEAFNLSLRLCSVPEHAHEGLKFVREQIPIAERALGPSPSAELPWAGLKAQEGSRFYFQILIYVNLSQFGVRKTVFDVWMAPPPVRL